MRSWETRIEKIERSLALDLPTREIAGLTSYATENGLPVSTVLAVHRMLKANPNAFRHEETELRREADGSN